MAERRASTGRKRQVAGSDFMEVISEVEQPLLAPGDSSRHDLIFRLLTTLELELAFSVDCPTEDVLGYSDDQEEWDDTPWTGGQTFGGFDPDLRVAEFSQRVRVNPDFDFTGKAKNQKLALKARARYGLGAWDTDIKLDHPIVVAN
jgi:hypothetical protein